MLIAETSNQSMHIPVRITQEDRNIDTRGFIDCGAGGKFIDSKFAQNYQIKTTPLRYPIEAKNVDGTPNKHGTITHYVRLPITINQKTKTHQLFVCGLGKQTVILGFPWLQDENLIIDWKLGTLTWRTPDPIAISELELDPQIEVEIFYLQNDELEEEIGETTPIYIARTTLSRKLILPTYSEYPDEFNEFDDFNDEIEEKTEEEIKAKLPEAYHEFLDIFSKKNTDKFPASTKYDHAINVKDSFQPRRMKPYILSPDQEKEVKEFIKENLKLG